MYNTSFVVRYHDIENELIINLHRKFMKKQEEEEREEKIAAARLAASKVAAAVAAIANLEIEKEKEKTPIVPPVKKKGGKKKATTISEATTTISESTTTTTISEEPKKRGRKKAVKVEEEPIKISLTIEPQPEPQTNITPEKVGDNDNDDNDDNCEDLEYSMEDVHLICEKLYRDELLSVFDVETINDENMDAGIKRVIEKMIDNSGFKQILEEIKQELMDLSNPTGTPEEIENIRRNLEYLIFITLFSQDVFYITHKCICQLFTVNEVHPDLLDRLKEKTIGLFKRN